MEGNQIKVEDILKLPAVQALELGERLSVFLVRVTDDYISRRQEVERVYGGGESGAKFKDRLIDLVEACEKFANVMQDIRQNVPQVELYVDHQLENEFLENFLDPPTEQEIKDVKHGLEKLKSKKIKDVHDEHNEILKLADKTKKKIIARPSNDPGRKHSLDLVKEVVADELELFTGRAENYEFVLGDYDYDFEHEQLGINERPVDMGTVFEGVEQISRWTKHILESRGGRPPKYLYESQYIYQLCIVFLLARHGKDGLPAYASSNVGIGYHGKLIDLVSDCLEFLSDSQGNSTIGDKVKKHLGRAKMKVDSFSPNLIASLKG